MEDFSEDEESLLPEFRDEIYFARERKQRVRRCPRCRGKGGDPLLSEANCLSCNGRCLVSLEKKNNRQR